MPGESMDRTRFLTELAPVTHGRAQNWGEEISVIDLKDEAPKGRFRHRSATMALSPYETKEQVAELVGHSGDVGKLIFARVPEIGAYALLSQGGDEENFKARDSIIMWHLDSDGKQIGRKMPMAVEGLADKSIEAIANDLANHHELDIDAINRIRLGFVETLKKADVQNRASVLQKSKGHFPSYNPQLISCDGKSVLLIEHGGSTQSGMRPKEELPQVVVRPLADISRVSIRLMGHTDTIIWASWSPVDPRTIATASWDGTHRIWNAETGECRHEIERPEKRQNWAGAFSPDGKYVLLSGTDDVGVYEVDTGKKISELKHDGLAAWVRTLAWSPSADEITLENSASVLLWRPFADRTGDEVNEVVMMKSESRLMTIMNFIRIEWLGRRGQKLAVRLNEGTCFVWDREKNVKWRFERPFGVEMDSFSTSFVYVEETETFLSLDGDWKIREWRLE
ncbi:unnamed protein product [Zymoseptoria tritici ST99CH_1E4]|uniref:Uncharacterized protein n=1 Tax=Zymoseptoria tritici ST99CH_1E4 TaxID=1276532 RepID=A0A2H1FK57_ZYMTR|nr:unnamed protein product [Zymoseptoria tritici ST99CH_1E4]